MMKYYYLFLATIFLMACNQKTGDRYLSNYQIYAANVDSGSTFIYRDSVMGTYDTFLVTYSSGLLNLQATTYGRDPDTFSVQSIYYDMKSVNHQPDSSICTFGVNSGSYNNATNASIYFYQSGTGLVYNDDARIYGEPFVTKAQVYYYNQKTFNEQQAVSQYPYYDLHGKKYATVFENLHIYKDTFKKSQSQLDTTIFKETRTFFSLDSGIIKFTIRTANDYRVKELIYSNIIRKIPL